MLFNERRNFSFASCLFCILTSKKQNLWVINDIIFLSSAREKKGKRERENEQFCKTSCTGFCRVFFRAAHRKHLYSISWEVFCVFNPKGSTNISDIDAILLTYYFLIFFIFFSFCLQMINKNNPPRLFIMRALKFHFFSIFTSLIFHIQSFFLFSLSTWTHN